MENLYTFSIQFFICLVMSSAWIHASEARILARLEQEKLTVPSTYCTKTLIVNGPDGEEARICGGKKDICESLQNHLDKRVYFCARCDKHCSLCVKVCQKNGCQRQNEPLSKCWKHLPTLVTFCKECEKECPPCLKKQQEELEKPSVVLAGDDAVGILCTTCDNEGERFERCSHGTFCNNCECQDCPQECTLCEELEESTVVLAGDNAVDIHCTACDNEGKRFERCSHGTFCNNCECQDCPQECTLCMDYKRPRNDPHWVKFSSCDHPGSRFCNECVVDLCENHNSKCPLRCEQAIEYPKCNMCRNYLGEDQPAVSWGCTGGKEFQHKEYSFLYNTMTEVHRCHPGCIEPFIQCAYKNYYGKPVFWCPLSHQDDVAFRGHEVEIDKVFFVNTPKIETLHVAEKAGMEQEHACHLCHQVISEEDEKGECIDTLCEWYNYGMPRLHWLTDYYRHKYHTGCLQFFVDKAAFRRDGGIGILCPVNHGYRSSSTLVNYTRFRELVDCFFSIVIPERFKVACSICNNSIQGVLSDEGVTHLDCSRSVGTFLKPKYRKQSYIVHAKCMARWLKQKGKEASKKVCSYPCPHHERTDLRHNLSMSTTLAATLRGLDEEL